MEMPVEIVDRSPVLAIVAETPADVAAREAVSYTHLTLPTILRV